MKAVRFVRPLQAEVIEIPSPSLKQGEVRVRIASVGVCGSDLRRFQDLVSPGVWPIVPGHECAGTVIEAGPDTNVQVGQRAALFPVTSCGACRDCRRGRPNHCPEMRIMGPTLPGGYAEEAVVVPSMLRPIPDSISFDEAALAEPLGVAVHAANLARIEEGDRVAILGAGAIGLLAQQVVKAKGAAHVLATGRGERKLALARELGADETVNVTQEAVVTSGRASSFDVVIDLVCDQSTVEQGMDLADVGGTVVFIATPSAGQQVGIPLSNPNIQRKELSFHRSRIYDTDFDEAIPLMVSGKVKALPIISHRYPLGQAPFALHEILRNRREIVKAVLQP